MKKDENYNSEGVLIKVGKLIKKCLKILVACSHMKLSLARVVIPFGYSWPPLHGDLRL